MIFLICFDTEFEQTGKLLEKYVIQHFDTQNNFSMAD